jgi:hypothetical protein
MSDDRQKVLEVAIRAGKPLTEVVELLRQYRAEGIKAEEVYDFLVGLRPTMPDEETEDRLLEIADFVAGFCSPHMKIWEN